MAQFVQVLGSLLILAAYTLAQQGRLDQRSRTYLVLNVVGSGVLAAEALLGQLWGFLLLEGVWALVSGVSLLRTVSPGRPASDAPDRPIGRSHGNADIGG